MAPCRSPNSTPHEASWAVTGVSASPSGTARSGRRLVEQHLGRVRWAVERGISPLLRFKFLGLRNDRTQQAL
ncbi:hypothetical protein ACFVYF_19350 [Streptomyces sp. NPDC058274]|uniref:hypothetical protein n=1 Tax=Streptomyces sp. NPDC058274 TaxID=3346416 RepID=UPI0036ED64A7